MMPRRHHPPVRCGTALAVNEDGVTPMRESMNALQHVKLHANATMQGKQKIKAHSGEFA